MHLLLACSYPCCCVCVKYALVLASVCTVFVLGLHLAVLFKLETGKYDIRIESSEGEGRRMSVFYYCVFTVRGITAMDDLTFRGFSWRET